jgi:2Fe-2S ferredoxin
MEDAAFAAQPAPDGMEGDMLEFAWEPKETSRLCCQLKVSDDVDGLVLRVPAQQA